MRNSPLSRRGFVRAAGLGAFGLTVLSANAELFAADGPKTALTPDQALEQLRVGNARFIADQPLEGPADHKRRLEIANGQAPFAAILGCADSRVAPELMFSRGLGELFIIRNAGNTANTAAMGSIEYAVAVLGVPLVVVLGHASCGAVDAALKVVKENAVYPGSIGPMIEPIVPAAIKAAAQPGDPLQNAIREHVARTVRRLRETEVLLQEPQKTGKLRIVGADYDLGNGKVDFFLT